MVEVGVGAWWWFCDGGQGSVVFGFVMVAVGVGTCNWERWSTIWAVAKVGEAEYWRKMGRLAIGLQCWWRVQLQQWVVIVIVVVGGSISRISGKTLKHRQRLRPWRHRPPHDAQLASAVRKPFLRVQRQQAPHVDDPDLLEQPPHRREGPRSLLIFNLKILFDPLIFFCLFLSCCTMRSEGNPLDLNNLPEDYLKEGRQILDDSSSSSGRSLNLCRVSPAKAYRKKRSSTTDEKDESGKVYECRFCSVKFCKSQALGGHMNRHRQGKETETLNKARHLVFTSDLSPGAHHPGYISSGQPIPHGNIMGDPTMPYTSIYPTRVFSGSSPLFPPPPQGLPPLPPPPPPGLPLPPPHPYLYTSPGQLVNDYFVAGHVDPENLLYSHSNSSHSSALQDTNFTCLGAPVGYGLPNGNVIASCSRGQDGVDDFRDMSLHNEEEGLG
ncbi:unnamed protein product [Fraxinus pennsylvanica]|uniref:C2H2-type domain-containing protein n=1 Tax=Fraxinus pennsylvanica TaxID=56036 RepID=A0AAD1ZE04_9LAMI|nr:unnamed protein product [Fraxinus pennsylvanica]